MNKTSQQKPNAITKAFARLLAVVVALTGIDHQPVKAESATPAPAAEEAEANNLVEMLSLVIDSFLSGKIPSFQEILATIFSTPEPENAKDDTIARVTSKALEGKMGGSYGITEDEAEAAIRKAARQAIEDSTLSKTAQKKLEETAKKTQQNVEESDRLGEESQSLDVTQQILQNMSKQDALAAAREGIVIQQNQQAQVDRAIGNTIATEQLEELSGANTARRREETASTNAAIKQIGLVSLPGLVEPEP